MEMRTRNARITAVTAALVVLAGGLIALPSAQASPLPTEARAKLVCTITGTEGPDRLVGTSGRDIICGLGGDDVILGLGGMDILDGGAGDDRIDGGKGQDLVIGGDGDDDVDGGTGDDAEFADEIVGDVFRWRVGLDSSYAGLPIGTKVSYLYDPPSGNCLSEIHEKWTHVVEQRDLDGWVDRQELFATTKAGPYQACGWQTSEGTWGIEIVTPSGAKRNGYMTVRTGAANYIVHVASVVECRSPGFKCWGGSDSQPNLEAKSKIVLPPMTIGPVQ